MIKTGNRVGPEDVEEDEEESSIGVQEMVESAPAALGSTTETEFESEDDSKRAQEVMPACFYSFPKGKQSIKGWLT